MRIAIYPGSFDPMTCGHLSVLERARALFDRVVIVVAVNPAKTSAFSAEERVDMIREACAEWQNVDARSTENLVVEFARSCGARFLVRGVRGATDAEYENALAR